MAVTASKRTGDESTPGAGVIRTTVVLPAYNEGAALPHVLTELGEYLDQSYEVLVVDDGSTDDTADVAAQYPVRLIKHKSNSGKGVAIRTGIAEAQGENVVIMDADATYPVPAIKEMVDLLDENDLVRGIRESEPESMPVVNRFGNWLFNKLLAISHGLEGADQLTGSMRSAARRPSGSGPRRAASTSRPRSASRRRRAGCGRRRSRSPTCRGWARRSSARGRTACGFSAG